MADMGKNLNVQELIVLRSGREAENKGGGGDKWQAEDCGIQGLL
jgi:hypothetical protein